jgi:hypothetical protein
MYKPIKRLYFWLKSKVYKMITKQNLKELLERRNSIFKTMISCMGENEINEYIIYDVPEKSSDNYEKIDFKIGDDKFTVHSFMDISNYKIYFKTFYWKFNPKLVNNDYEKSHIDDLDILSLHEKTLMKGLQPANSHIANELSNVVRVLMLGIMKVVDIKYHFILVLKRSVV